MSSEASETRSTGAEVSADPGFRQVRDLSDTISTGFRFIRAHASTLYRPLFFICMPIRIVASLLLGSFFQTIQGAGGPGTGGFISMFAGYVLAGLSFLLASAVICEYMRLVMLSPGTRPTLGAVWRETRRNIIFYLVLSFVTGAMMTMGFFLLVIPGIFLLVVFQFSYPLHAFERADFGACIGRAFSLAWGRWWMTFALLIGLFGMAVLLHAAIDIPGWLITGFGSLSGMDWSEDPEGAGRRMQWFFTFFALIASVTELIVTPFVQVPMCYHMLSTLERNEAPGLLEEVHRFSLEPTPTAKG